ncbi:antitermination protein NusG [Nonlabens sp. MB-3u-79]|uniref:UpxY family transcription antiterminator n=1 Tax=Nonlabens sp. MB-3u-79 TaxID=2058134 RepID=UPI000C316BF0|nr:UpxY family transcription antiterminator [Nonlabens sp. MB-3u-79]AUC79533.1 antitermination protein NusG [Nonlabens sp. MB-3u-79]
MNWLVLYTKPKNEVKVAQGLATAGINVYCPMLTTVKQWSDRKKKVSLPLFASYVFVQVTESQRSSVFDIPGVVRYLFWLGKPAIVREEEINAIKELLSENSYKEVRVASLEPGDSLILKEGVFKGQTATFKEQKGNQTILILSGFGTKLILNK